MSYATLPASLHTWLGEANTVGGRRWRGLRDCGAALEEIGTPAAIAVGANFSRAAPGLLTQLRKSMAADAFGDRPRCFPYVAGVKQCGMLSPEASNRDSVSECGGGGT